MTREEAIKLLRKLRDTIDRNNKYGEAEEMAIQALEQEPSGSENPNNCDLISREDALMALTGEWTEITDEIIHRFIRRIKALPSVKPSYSDDELDTIQRLEQAQIEKAYQLGQEDRPTGHWIIMGDRYIKCSECGHITKTESPDIYHFCMVCGANMSENPTGSEPQEDDWDKLDDIEQSEISRAERSEE